MQSKRTQPERSAATRAALIAAARALFSDHGYASVGTETIASSAGMTRGALYHQFADKRELFAAVFETVEAELAERIATVVAGGGGSSLMAALELGAAAWLDACAEPEVHRIVLLDAPGVLGWERWREIGLRYGMGLVEQVIAAAIEAEELPRQPVEPLAHVLIGALDEAALYCARSEDPARARDESLAVFHAVLAGLTTNPR